MGYNFVTNISGCIESATQLMQGNLNLVYYSHIPVAIIAFLIGFFVIIKNRKNLSSRVMFSLCMIFALWIICNLISWVSPSSVYVTFFWSMSGLLNSLLFFSCIYLLYTYKNDKDMPLWLKMFLGLLLLPILIMTPTHFNVGDFNYTECYPVDNLFFGYMTYLEIITSIIMVIIAIKRYRSVEQQKKHEIVLISFAVVLFLLSKFETLYLSDKFQRYDIEVYGVFAMSLFLGFLAYLIVKYKAFDIKLVGAQALVWALIILTGSQFFYLGDSTLVVKILTSITLIISSVLGFFLVSSVKKENELNEQLKVSNAGQTNLIHIMNHQIKGYLSISKNIFAELLTDDYGKVPEDAKEIISAGLENADKGAKYVAAILRGESAENGTLCYEMKPLDFKSLVSDVVSKEKEIAEKKGLKLNIDVDNSDYNILGDVSQLGEAVRNLIDNSIFYTPSGGIEVSLTNKGNTVLLKVKDTGVGVKEEDKSKLFKAGGVGTDSIKINTNSSGYGLAFVKGVIEKHNGKVWFESAGAGLGSTFFVELPVK